jgi:hypothetical protein
MKDFKINITTIIITFCLGFFFCYFKDTLKMYFFNKNDRVIIKENQEFTVQQRTMYKLGLLWDDKPRICKTKNYTVTVKIAGKNAYNGETYPLVSINGSPFIESKAFGDFFMDKQEFVFYHDKDSSAQPKFTVRFEWDKPDKNQTKDSECYFDTLDKNHTNIFEYGKIIIPH